MPPARKSDNLFRPEVLEEQGNKIFSETLLIHPPNFIWVFIFFVAFFLLFIITLIFGSYQNSVTLHGTLYRFEGSEKTSFEAHFPIQETKYFAIGQKVILEINLPEKVSPRKLKTVESKIQEIFPAPGASPLGNERQDPQIMSTGNLFILRVPVDSAEIGRAVVLKNFKNKTPLKARVITGEETFIAFVKRSLNSGGEEFGNGGN